MAPAALWAALAFGLQLWAAGRAVPVQVGASRGHGVRLPLTPTPGSAGHELPGRRHGGAGLGATEKPRAPPGQTLRAAGDPLGTSVWHRGGGVGGTELRPPRSLRPYRPGRLEIPTWFPLGLRRPSFPSRGEEGACPGVLRLLRMPGTVCSCRAPSSMTSSSSGLWFSSFLEIQGLHF